MSLKSIRESYSNLLNVFETAGASLTESQKSDLDTFVLALESKMDDVRKTAIKQTKSAVEKKMEREYKEVFESIMAAMRQNSELAAKIQDKITRINESKKIATKVNDYLDLYVESVLPKKSIVDYDRMQKLEKLNESLNGVDIQDLEKSYKIKKSKCETEVAKLRVKLDESMKKTEELQKKLDCAEAKDLLESKIADLPVLEARRVRRALSGSSVAEIEQKFDMVVESVRKRVNETAAEPVKTPEPAKEPAKEPSGELTLEDEIKGVLECDVQEDDMLKNRPHNNHKSVSESEDIDEDFETAETVNMTAEGDVVLEESDIIDGDLMQMWCSRSICVD